MMNYSRNMKKQSKRILIVTIIAIAFVVTIYSFLSVNTPSAGTDNIFEASTPPTVLITTLPSVMPGIGS